MNNTTEEILEFDNDTKFKIINDKAVLNGTNYDIIKNKEDFKQYIKEKFEVKKSVAYIAIENIVCTDEITLHHVEDVFHDDIRLDLYKQEKIRLHIHVIDSYFYKELSISFFNNKNDVIEFRRNHFNEQLSISHSLLEKILIYNNNIKSLDLTALKSNHLIINKVITQKNNTEYEIGIVKISLIDTDTIRIRNFKFNSDIYIYNLNTEKLDVYNIELFNDSKLKIENSTLSTTTISNVKNLILPVKTTTIENLIIRDDIHESSEIKLGLDDVLINSQLVFPVESISTMTRNTARLIKNNFYKENNRIDGLLFHKQEMNLALKESKKCSYNWWLLILNKYSNEFGTNWIRGAICSILLALIFGLISVCYSGEFSFNEWFKNALYQINIFKFDYASSDLFQIALFTVSKITIGFCIYQTIQAFRKYKM